MEAKATSSMRSSPQPLENWNPHDVSVKVFSPDRQLHLSTVNVVGWPYNRLLRASGAGRGIAVPILRPRH